MTAQQSQPESAASDALSLEQRLRSLGVVLVACDEAGMPQLSPTQRSDWLSLLLGTPAAVHDALRSAARLWSERGWAPRTVLDGLVLVPLQRDGRRRTLVQPHVALVPSESLVESAFFPAMCDAAKLDVELARTMLRAAHLPRLEDIDRISALIRLAVESHYAWQREMSATESVSQQLGESYEEINLLYTITRSMGVMQRPGHFVSVVCEELLATMPYRWIAAVLADDPTRLKRLAGRIITAGTAPRAAALRERMESLFTTLEPERAVVLDPRSNSKHAGFARFGAPIIVQPISTDGAVVGLLIAADKQGRDTAASSVDIKLLGASATNMAIFLENAALYEDLNGMFLGTLEALTASIDAKDRYTSGHSKRVALLTQQLAAAVGLDEHQIGRMHIAGLVHDVGKIGVPERVLLKPGKLTEEEFEWIRRHPEMGYRILKDIPQLRDVLPGVLHHHERWDGGGYPNGIAGEAIPLVGRLIALADSFDAMSSTRTYRSSMSRAEVIKEITRCAGSQFDPALAQAFVQLDFAEYDRLVKAHRAGDDVLREYGGEAA